MFDDNSVLVFLIFLVFQHYITFHFLIFCSPSSSFFSSSYFSFISFSLSFFIDFILVIVLPSLSFSFIQFSFFCLCFLHFLFPYPTTLPFSLPHHIFYAHSFQFFPHISSVLFYIFFLFISFFIIHCFFSSIHHFSLFL